ncbi:MAG: polysaccharide pyruvyl transferase family protein [Peptococcaceae bacterium]|jgi:polysaccharide pyruvyl transferase WcaK-like protein|nr:polysaccharide pyruvyl transferase family protein [Peptococcaceae bacterium]MDH7524533.1 polysaccharide pyruvyl transferase family protein [Peptococcaceae bacterium]
MKKLLLVYGHGPDNGGDMALNYGAIDVLNDAGEFEIEVVSRFDITHPAFYKTKEMLEGRYDNVRLIPYPVGYDRHRQSSLQRLRSYTQGARLYLPHILYPASQENLISCVDRADLIVFNGGNLLFSRGLKEDIRLLGICYPLFLAKKMGKPYILFPQSMPPTTSYFGQKVLKGLLAGSSHIWLRDFISGENLRGKFPELRLENNLDLAFYINKYDDEKAGSIMDTIQCTTKFVAVILRASTLGDAALLNNNEIQGLIRFINELTGCLLERNLKVVFVVQTKMDEKITVDYISQLNCQQVKLVKEFDPLVLRAIYSKAEFVVSFRLHACILALSAGTKAVALYREMWGPKMPGIYQSLGIPGVCLNYEKSRASDVLSAVDCNHDSLRIIDERINENRKNLLSSLRKILTA